ncbi:MAG: fibronectin type III domain-containing protein [Ferruginibacter sp.]
MKNYIIRAEKLLQLPVLIIVLLCCVTQSFSQQVTILPTNGAHSPVAGPLGSVRQQRAFYLVTPAEMQASGIQNGTTITSIGFTFGLPQSFSTKGAFKVYLQNTTDTSSRQDTAWTTVTTLTNNKSLAALGKGQYEWQVSAECASASSFSDISSFSTDNSSGCNAPTSLFTSLVTTNSARFNWTIPSSVVTKYYIEYRPQETITWIEDSTTQNFYDASGLTPDKIYQWRLRTKCGAVYSDEAGSSFSTDNISQCSAPSALSVFGVTDTLANLSWTGAAGATFYNIQFRRLGAAQWLTATSNSNSFTIIFGLIAGTTYEWRIKTFCTGGSASGSYVQGANFTTSGPTVCYTPTNLEANGITDSTVHLTWNPVISAASYSLRYRLKESISWANAIAAPMVEVHNDSLDIPNTNGPYNISFANGTPFVYNGNGLYIAWEYSRDTGALALPGTTMSTDVNSVILDMNGQDSIRLLRSFVASTTSSTMPSLITGTRIRPQTRLGSSQLADSVSVAAVFALGKVAPAYSDNKIRAIITNHSTTAKNYTVRLTVKNEQGVQRYTADSSIHIAADTSGEMQFAGWNPSLLETDSLIISVPADAGENVINNNRHSYIQQVTASLVSHADKKDPLTETGFNTTDGLILAKHFLKGCGKVNAANVYLTGSAKGNQVYAVLLDNTGTLIAQSENYTVAEEAINNYHSFLFTSPASLQNEAYYIGIAQVANSQGYNPAGVQWEGTFSRDNAYFRNKITADSLWEETLPGRLMIEASLAPGSSAVAIDGKLSLCTGATNTLTATKIEARFANKVLDFSSQQTPLLFGAVQALGSANAFPQHGLNANAWTSATADGSREFLTLQFPGASPINFIDIYESFNPGAIDTVYVKNPLTSSYVAVFTGTAITGTSDAGSTSANKKHISFPLTGFNVNEIRIALNSPVDTGFNAIDAAAIGVVTSPGGFDTYLWTPGGETSATKAVTSPGVYKVTITTAGGCTATDSVTVFTPSQQPPVISASGPLSFCIGDSVTLTSNKPTGNTWSPGGATTKSIKVFAAGSYTVSHDDGTSCGITTSSAAVVTVNNPPTVSITGVLGICPGNQTTLNAGAGFSSYLWNTGAISQTISVNNAGSYSVRVTNNNGCRNTATATTFFTSIPPPTITGNLSFCPGGNTVLDAGAGYSSYSWSTGASTRTITVSNAANISVTVTNANGCSASSAVVTSIYNPPVPQILGNSGFCAGGSLTLTATAGYVNYLWSTTETTSSINVNTAGLYSVTVTDNNGCTGTSSRSAIQYPSPSPVISGTLSFCAGTTTTLNAGTGYSSYLWSTGATSQTIVVNTVSKFVVTVTSSNGCTGKDSVNTSLTGAIPASPGPISGSVVGGCGSNGNIYSINPVSNTSHYVWTAPAGATIASGQGSTSVTINFGAAFRGGDIIVAASNACGQSPTLTARKLFVKALADKPGNITGQVAGLCGPTTKTYSIAAVPLATSYTWTLPPGASISGGQGGLSLTVNFASGFSNGNLCVTANNACGSSQPSCVMLSGISPTPGAISGSSTVCNNQQGLAYSVAPVPGATSYTWTLPQTAVLSSGQGTNSIVIKMGIQSGDITVRANSACGSSSLRTKTITVMNCPGNAPIFSMPQLRPVPEVVSNYGGFTSTGNISIEWTLGEPRIETSMGNNLLYSQGFHQPLVYLPQKQAEAIAANDNLKIIVYPNPVSSILKVELRASLSQQLSLELTDVNMRVLQRRYVFTAAKQIAEMNMAGFIAGSYYLVVRDMTGRIIQTIKLDKIE